MPKPTFVLKDPDAKNSTAIKLLYSCSDGRLPYYTGESISPANWPHKIPRGTTAILNRITDAVNSAIERFKIAGDPLTKASLKAALDATLKRTTIVKSDLFKDMERVIAKMQAGEILTLQNKRYSAGSLKTLRFTMGLLKKFDPKMTAAGTTMETYRKFIAWCQKRDLSTNYIGAQLKNWKRLGHLASGAAIFSHPEFKKIQEETHDIYLNEKELALLFKQKLSQREEVVRDWFILGCYTGLRVSDLVMLSGKNLGKKFITIANEKTDEKVVIPVHPVVQKILDKYKGFPPAVTDVEINRTIKVVAKNAGIDDDVLFTITKGGKRKDHYLKKWEMISTHTCRRTFITNFRKTGNPDNVLMKLTGIRSPGTLKKYDKLSPDEAAKIAAGLKFFK